MSEETAQPSVFPSQLEAQIRFGLSDLTSRNASSAFEELCRHLAQARLVSNVLPATGPVARLGDQGRDFETFRSFLREELGPYGAFLGLVSSGPVAFACTLQQEGLETKIRSDVEKILASGTEVALIYVFSSAVLSVGRRHTLQQEVAEAYDVHLEILDQLAISSQLAQPDTFWIAVQYLSIPASLTPEREENNETRTSSSWYENLRGRWRRRDRARPFLGDLLQLKDGLRYAAFHQDARIDLPFWLQLMRPVAEARDEPIVRQRARYEISIAHFLATGDLRAADAHIRSFVDEALSARDPTTYEDTILLLSYATVAALWGTTTISPAELSDWIERIKTTATAEAVAAPDATGRVRWLQVRAKVGLLHDPHHLTLPEGEVERPDVPRLVEGIDVRHPRQPVVFIWLVTDLVDMEDAMEALSEFGDLLPDAPLLPVEELAQILQVLAPRLVDHPDWSKIVEALDKAVARSRGGAAAADVAWSRANSLYLANRPLEALTELHRARLASWSGDAVRGALLHMLLIAQCYWTLGFRTAGKHYALAVVHIARSSSHDVLDLVPVGLLIASLIERADGAWCSALELANLGLVQATMLVGDTDNTLLESLTGGVFANLGMTLQASRVFSGEIAERVEWVAENNGLLGLLEEATRDSPWTIDSHVRSADAEVRGRPFSDLGPKRIFRFKALETEWRVSCRNDYRHVIVAERFVSGAQIFAAELARKDVVSDSRLIKIEIVLDSSGRTFRPIRLSDDPVSIWRVRLTPLVGGNRHPKTLPWKQILLALSTICADLSGLSMAKFVDVVEQEGDDFPPKFGAAQLYDDVSAVLTEDLFDSIPRQKLLPPADPLAGPISEHPSLIQSPAASSLRALGTD